MVNTTYILANFAPIVSSEERGGGGGKDALFSSLLLIYLSANIPGIIQPKEERGGWVRIGTGG